MLVIGMVHKNLVATGIDIHEAQNLVTRRGIYQLVNPWQGKAIIGTCFVQINVILANTLCVVRLLH